MISLTGSHALLLAPGTCGHPNIRSSVHVKAELSAKRPAMQNTLTFIVSVVDHAPYCERREDMCISVKVPLPDTECLYEASLTLLPYGQN